MDRAGRRFRLTNLDPMGYDASADDPLYKAIPYVLVVDAEGAAHGVFYDTTADPVFDFGHEHDNYHPHYRYMAPRLILNFGLLGSWVLERSWTLPRPVGLVEGAQPVPV